MSLAQVQRELARLSGRVATLERRNKALALTEALRIKRVVTNIGPVAIGTTDVPIVWPIPFADDTYFVVIEFLVGAGAIGTLEGTVKAGTRTQEGCTVTVSAAAAVTVAVLDVLGIRP